MLDEPVVSFIKDFIWAPALALIAWAWNRNEKTHEQLWDKAEKLETGMLTASSGLNDRLMEHIDVQIGEVKQLVRDEDNKLAVEQATQRGHIGKLFDKIEAHAQRSEDRHNEMMGVLRNMTESFHVALSKKQDK